MFIVLLHFYSSNPTPAYGEIAAALRRRSHKVWVGQPAADGSFVFLDGGRVVDRLPRAPRGRAGSLPAMIDIRSHLRALSPDIVQTTPHPWSWVLAAAPPRNTAFLNDIRTAGSGLGTGLRAWLIDASAWLSWRIGAAALYRQTLFLNETGARWLFGSGWAKKARVVPLGVGEHFLEHHERRCAGVPDIVRFVYVGTMSLQRNLGQMLAAARVLGERTRRFRLTLLGPDDGAGGLAAVRELIAREALDEVVEVAGPVPYDRVPEVLAGFDVALNYVPATRVQKRQTFMKVLESRALGLPQIATRTEPNRAVITDGDNGLLVDDSAEAYAQAMRRIMEEPGLLERLRRGAETTREGVSWMEVADRQLSIYQELRNRS